MNLDFGSLAFNMNVKSGGTPSWGTALGQNENYKISVSGYQEFIPGMVFNMVPNMNLVRCPLGKGGKVLKYSEEGDFEYVLASLFNKVYVNETFVDECSFILLITKELSTEHAGRLSLKYSPKIEYDSISNLDAFSRIRETLGLTERAAWFITDIEIRNQDQLHFTAFVGSKHEMLFETTKDRKTFMLSKLPKSTAMVTNRFELPDDNRNHVIIDILDDSDQCSTINDFKKVLKESSKEITKEFPSVVEAATLAYLRNFKSFIQLKLNSKKTAESILFDSNLYSKSGSGSGVTPILNIFNKLYRHEDRLCGIKIYETQYLQNKLSSSTICEVSSDTVQKIFYGAPGTGKSHRVKEITGEIDGDKSNVFRTTFHPDSDYATFVGCYKPTMQPTGQIRKIGTENVEIEEIRYSFVPQAFTNAYIYAYDNPEEKTYLVIEEINRGNCAQIFGDLFQLLDRKEGVSEYSIKADTDLAEYLNKKAPQSIVDGKLILPSNLNILATMNTSDQSLFPIDSAFKRRWDWEYIPINYSDENSSKFLIRIGDNSYKWIDFIKAINSRIFDITLSEDKQLGNYFIHDTIEKKEFIGKVMFYLWTEVLKEEFENPKYFFRTSTEDKFTFNDLFDSDSDTIISDFFEYLGIQLL